jgi:hypothetical protein
MAYNGWITKLKIEDNGTTCETPANHAVVEANSLYECNNTFQLINFYYATLNYPVIFYSGKSDRQRLPERIFRPNILPCSSAYQGQ